MRDFRIDGSMSEATGARLRAWRKAAGFTQADVAERLGITAAMVCEYENARKLPHSAIQARIQVLTGIPMIGWHPAAEIDVRQAIAETVDEDGGP